jgi:hypothetical protein
MLKEIMPLATAINEIVRLANKRERKGTLRAKEMRRGLANALEAIDSLLKDDGTLYKLVENKREYINFMKNMDNFEKIFIPHENGAMNNAGVSKEAKVHLIRQVRNCKECISDDSDYRVNIRSKLETVKKGLQAYLDLLADSGDRNAGMKAVRKDWRKIAKVVGGVTLVGVDATIGSHQPGVSAISSAIGVSLIRENLKE